MRQELTLVNGNSVTLAPGNIAFHFDVQGLVAKSTHAGIPQLRFIRQRLGQRVHFWPFDGWQIPPWRSVIAEIYPARWSRNFAREKRTGDQHDAYISAAWLSHADRNGSLAAFLETRPDAAPSAVAQVEGWILGVSRLDPCGQRRDDTTTYTACNQSVFRLH